MNTRNQKQTNILRLKIRKITDFVQPTIILTVRKIRQLVAASSTDRGLGAHEYQIAGAETKQE